MQLRKVKPKKWGVEMGKPSDVHYPSFNIDTMHLPEAKKWEVGKTYKIVLEVKQTSINESKGGGSVGFDIMGIGVMDGKGMENKKEKKETVKRRYEDKEEVGEDY